MSYVPSAALSGSGGVSASAMTYAPTLSSTLAGTGSAGIAQGASMSAMSYAPTQSTVLGGSGSGAPADFGAGLTNTPYQINQEALNKWNQELSQEEQEAENKKASQQKMLQEFMSKNAKRSSANLQAPTNAPYTQAQENLQNLLKRNR